jgi:hypothetical protein
LIGVPLKMPIVLFDPTKPADEKTCHGANLNSYAVAKFESPASRIATLA